MATQHLGIMLQIHAAKIKTKGLTTQSITEDYEMCEFGLFPGVMSQVQFHPSGKIKSMFAN